MRSISAAFSVQVPGQMGRSAGRPARYRRRAATASAGRGWTAVLPFFAYSADKVTVGGSLSRLKAFGHRLANSEARKPLAQATGGDARRVADGGSIDLPRVVPVRASSIFRGDGWMGVKMRDASVVKGVGVLPMVAGLVGLLLLLGAFAATWRR